MAWPGLSSEYWVIVEESDAFSKTIGTAEPPIMTSMKHDRFLYVSIGTESENNVSDKPVNKSTF
jgi:hypothetical protein